MDRFKEITIERENELWKYIDRKFKFKPYRNIKLRISNSIPSRIVDFSNEIGENNIDEVFRAKNEMILNLFYGYKDRQKITGMNWKHICYDFTDISKESFRINEWPYSIFPDGDYVFLFSEDMKNIVFCDGIDYRIYFIGEGW